MKIGPAFPSQHIDYGHYTVNCTPQTVASQASSTLSSTAQKGGGGFFFTCLNVITWPIKQIFWIFQKVVGWMFCVCCYAKDVQSTLLQIDNILALLKSQGSATLNGEEDYTLVLNKLPKWVFSELLQEELKYMAKEAGQDDEEAFALWLEANASQKIPFIEKTYRGYMDHFDQLPALFTRLKLRLQNLSLKDS